MVSDGLILIAPPTNLLTSSGEIIANIQDDTDKLEEVAKQSIVKLTPDRACVALTKAWSADQLRDLVKLVNTYLATLTTAPPPRDLSIPSGLRRS
jgi:hypothetical protein